MKLDDVKVGMRVACLDANGVAIRFETVKEVSDLGTIILSDSSTWSAAFLRKVKPKQSVSWVTVVFPNNEDEGIGELSLSALPELVPLFGKRVRVTVKEIK